MPRRRTFGVPYESSVGVKPVLVGWCPDCMWAYDPYPGPGILCDGEHEWKLWAAYNYGNGDYRRLHKRLMYKCPQEDMCEMYYLTLDDLIEHEHRMI